MDDIPRQKLRAIVSAHGRAVCQDSQRMNGLLTEVCPEHPREVEVLSQALDELQSDDAFVSLGERPWKAVANQLVEGLVDRHSQTEDEARWAATSWGIALGEITPDQPGAQLAPLLTNGSEVKVAEAWKPSSESWKPALASANPSFSETGRRPGMQFKTLILMVIAIIAGLIASAMTFRLTEKMRNESSYHNQPTSYWSKKLQEPIQRREVWQGHVKVFKDMDPAADLRSGDPAAIPVLIELLRDDSATVRQEAATILGLMGFRAGNAVEALREAATKDSDSEVRARAAKAIGQIDPDADSR